MRRTGEDELGAANDALAAALVEEEQADGERCGDEEAGRVVLLHLEGIVEGDAGEHRTRTDEGPGAESDAEINAP